MFKGIFLGPPGAGKGTQAKKAVTEFGLNHLSPGDILRSEVSNNTKLGKTAKSYMEKGELVPDSVIIGMMKNKISKVKGGFILDGFPRTIEQAKALDEMLEEFGNKLSGVLNFEVSEDEIVFRLSNRISCPKCKSIFHKINMPPKVDGVCDNCGAELVTRKDDNEESIRTRLNEYNKKTSPLIEYYLDKGILSNISGTGSSDEIYKKVVEAIKRR